MLDRIAAENAAMYTEQRSIAQTLQHALLPEALPDLDGMRAGARYVPATSGVEVGGDWYDVVELAKDKILLVIGDVSGHGLRAATTMASLRHATLAYAADDPRPAAVLGKLSDFVNRTPHAYFATVICALIDVPAHMLTLASAGHLPPLLIAGGEGDFIDLDVGVPIGVVRAAPYVETRVEVPRQATMIAYTDGLVERRGELLDIGLQRLASVATEQQLALEDLLTKLPRELASDDHHDDTAILGIQWTS
jgi:serine phosphatase RsbU (regulator of sigma subunit)